MRGQIRSLATLIMFAVIGTTAAGDGILYLMGKEYETKTIEVEGEIINYAPQLISMQTVPYADTSKINSVLRQKGYRILICRQFGRTGHYSYLIEIPESEDSLYSAPELKADKEMAGEIDYCRPCYTGEAIDGLAEAAGLGDGSTALVHNLQNPFREETEIEISLPEEVSVIMQVYNIQGRLVRTLIEKKLPAGVHKVRWDGCDEYGGQVPTGVYFLRFRAGATVQTRKMILLK